MALPGNADVIVAQGYWWDEATGQGVRDSNNQPATITFDPVPLAGGDTTRTPNLRDLAVSGYVKTRSRIATVDATTGYFAIRLVASNDPDLDAYGGRRVTFAGETPFVVEVPYSAPETTVTAAMAAKTGLTQGSTVRAVWLTDMALTTTPTPAPSISYLTSTQTLSAIADAVDDITDPNWLDIVDRPDLAAVATSGLAADLSDFDDAVADIVAASVSSSIAVNVKDFGTAGDGSDATAAFDAARAASDIIAVPPGTYVYSGSGLEADKLVLTGASAENTIIILTSGKSLIVAAGQVASMHVSGLRFVGGFGAIRLSATGISVFSPLVVQDNQFRDYTGTAVSSASIDQPYWRIRDNEFDAINDTTATMGVALAGDNAGSVITGNHFETNRVHIKLGQNTSGTGGSAVHIHSNDFLRFSAPSGVDRTDLWVVPTSDIRSSGMLCHDNKFGNENLGPEDRRVLYADENTGSGTDVATRLYSTSPSSRRLAGQIYRGNYQGSISSARPAFITSYAPITLAQAVVDHTLDGSEPTAVISIAVTPTTMPNRATSVVGPLFSSELGITSNLTTVACNVPGYAYLVDPTGQAHQVDGNAPFPGGSSLTGLADLTASRILSAFSTSGGSSISPSVDALGGTDAAVCTVPAGAIFTALSSVDTARPVWVEFDARTGGGVAVTSLRVSLAVSGSDRWKREVPLDASWRRWRFRAFAASNPNQVTFIPPSAGGTFEIGRVRVYQSSEPVALDLVVRAGATANRPAGAPTGRQYFDTTLGKPVWWNGSAWNDAAGTVV